MRALEGHEVRVAIRATQEVWLITVWSMSFQPMQVRLLPMPKKKKKKN